MIPGVISFDKSTTMWILSIFNKCVDEENYIVDKDTRNRIIASDGKELKVDEFAGIMKGRNGELLFIRSDIVSLIEVSDIIKERSLKNE